MRTRGPAQFLNFYFVSFISFTVPSTSHTIEVTGCINHHGFGPACEDIDG